MLIGICGKTNTGKSTFFKAATLIEVERANRPFVTLKANEGFGFARVPCVDKEFRVQCKPKYGFCKNNVRFVPIKLLDVPGLIEGAHEGHGLGNQFLDDLRQADAFIHIIDAAGTTNSKGEPVEPGSYDPVNDIRFFEYELDQWYLRLIKKGWDKFARQVHQERQQLPKAISHYLSGLGVTERMIELLIDELNLPDNITTWDEKTLAIMAHELREKTKPMLTACNKMDIPIAAENFQKLKKEFPGQMLVPCSAESELALREASRHNFIDYLPGDSGFSLKGDILSEEQKLGLSFIKENVLEKWKNTGVQQTIDTAIFQLLKYIAIFPVANPHLQDKDGNTLPDCLLVPDGINASSFAFRVHSDIGKNFIKAIDMKTKQIIGKEHALKHRDVVEIVTSK